MIPHVLIFFVAILSGSFGEHYLTFRWACETRLRMLNELFWTFCRDFNPFTKYHGHPVLFSASTWDIKATKQK